MPHLDWTSKLLENVARVRADIAAACRRRGRDPAGVGLVAVTKYVSVDVVRAVVAAGVVDLGENHAQQLVARAQASQTEATPGGEETRWHMIGHVQRNKVKLLLPHTRMIHSLDSERLAEALEFQAASTGVDVDVLIEVNLAGEASKTGVSPAEVAPLIVRTADCRHVRLRGLMTMAPYDADPEAARPYFAKLRGLLEDFRSAGAVRPDCHHLSMGMSQDYVVAVEEGATLVRVGSALFEGLPSTDPRSG